MDFATRDHGAKDGEDYTATSGTLTFTAGQTSKTITVPILNDDVYESSGATGEIFFIDITNPSGATLPDPPAIAVRIDSEEAVPTASMADVTVEEGAGTMTLTLRLSHPSQVDIAYFTRDDHVTGTATEGEDYDDFLLGAGRIARITVPAFNLSQTFDITLVDDGVDEPDETIVIIWQKLSTSDVTPSTFTFTGTITDNDATGSATGKPVIFGTIEVGQTLTADTSGIADPDGLTNVSYTYQWVRVDGTNETNIAGATGSSYTLVAADEGKGIRVRVSFNDDAGNPETLTSDVYRAVTLLPAPRLPAVDDPNAIWMATLTVANLGSNQYGYKGSQGGLTDTAFTYLGDDTPLSGGTYQEVGTLYTIDELSYHTGTGQLLFSLDGQFVGGSAANIFVDVGGTQRSFSQGTYSSVPHTYTFSIPNPLLDGGRRGDGQDRGAGPGERPGEPGRDERGERRPVQRDAGLGRAGGRWDRDGYRWSPSRTRHCSGGRWRRASRARAIPIAVSRGARCATTEWRRCARAGRRAIRISCACRRRRRRRRFRRR